MRLPGGGSDVWAAAGGQGVGGAEGEEGEGGGLRDGERAADFAAPELDGVEVEVGASGVDVGDVGGECAVVFGGVPGGGEGSADAGGEGDDGAFFGFDEVVLRGAVEAPDDAEGGRAGGGAGVDVCVGEVVVGVGGL